MYEVIFALRGSAHPLSEEICALYGAASHVQEEVRHVYGRVEHLHEEICQMHETTQHLYEAVARVYERVSGPYGLASMLPRQRCARGLAGWLQNSPWIRLTEETAKSKATKSEQATS